MSTVFYSNEENNLISTSNSPGYRLSTLYKEKERDLKKKQLSCALIVCLYTRHSTAKDPRELFMIRPVGDVEKSNTSALQETSTAPHSKKCNGEKKQKQHMKGNTDRKENTEQLQTVSALPLCLQQVLIFH